MPTLELSTNVKVHSVTYRLMYLDSEEHSRSLIPRSSRLNFRRLMISLDHLGCFIKPSTVQRRNLEKTRTIHHRQVYLQWDSYFPRHLGSCLHNDCGLYSIRPPTNSEYGWFGYSIAWITSTKKQMRCIARPFSSSSWRSSAFKGIVDICEWSMDQITCGYWRTTMLSTFIDPGRAFIGWVSSL